MSLTKIGSIGINTGIQLAGVTTIATLNASDNVLSVGGTVNFVDNVSFGGTVSIAGTLTYEDVTNVDSVGLITARNGIVVGSGITLSKDGDIFATGITTVSGNVKVGTGITLSPDGDIFATGVSTTGSIVCNGALSLESGNLDIADSIRHFADIDTKIRFPAADTITAETGGSERLRIFSNGDISCVGATDNNIYNDSSGGGINFKSGGQLVIAKEASSGADPLVWLNDTGQTTNKFLLFAQDGTEKASIGLAGNDLRFARDGYNETIRINSDGDLGVNNASPSAKLDVVSADASGYIAEFRQSNTSNSGQIIIDSPTDGDSRPVLIDMARAGTVKWSIGQGYNSSGGAFHISNGTLQSGVSNSKVTITTSGDMGVGTLSPERKLDVSGTGNVYGKFQSTNTTGAGIEVKDTGQNWLIQADNGGGNSSLAFYDRTNTSYRVHMKDNGNLEIVNGNLVVASGHGIDFSADGNASGMASELFDDYEEGTWTPFVGTQSGTDYTLGTTYNYYTKIGNIVHAHFKYQFTAEGNGSITLFNIPFAADANVDLVGQGYVTSGSTRLSIQYVKYTQTLLLPRVDDGVNYQNYWTARGSWAPTNTFVMHITYKVA